jgi:type IV secretory pathway TraG/TraD family ATPase VirD4
LCRKDIDRVIASSEVSQWWNAPGWLLIGFPIVAVGVRIFERIHSARLHRRGAVIRHHIRPSLRALTGLPKRSREIHLAGQPVSRVDETKHFKLIGTTGTGKSTAIRGLIDSAMSRGDRAVIADPDGTYLDRFYDPFRGDVILNPFDDRAARWDWTGEIERSYDVEQLASSLIPASEDSSAQEWRGYARTFLTAVVRRCHALGRADPAELWRLVTVADPAELRPLIAGTPAQPFLDPDNARMFGSIRSVAGSAIAAFEHVAKQRTAPFSVRKWIRATESVGILFLPYTAGQIAALRTLIAAWLRFAIFETMDGPEADTRALWFIVDELDALGAIDGLKDALARLRKFGGRCVLGFQSIAQVSSTYGAGSAQTIVENCGNTLILRCAGSENGGTSHFASKLIGEREVLRRQRSRGRDRDGAFGMRPARTSSNVSEQFVTEAAVMPSEIEQLPDLCGYLKIASRPVWQKIKLKKPSDSSAPRWLA